VVAAPAGGRRTKRPVGFLVLLAVVGILIYFGIAPARGYVRYYQMKEAMQEQAGYATSLTDDDIRRQLRTKATELGLPAEAYRVTIRRRGRPREITMSATWTDTVAVLFYAVPITYRPQVRAPL
jgi:hypothetical protein